MGVGTVVSGLIALALGAAGLMAIYGMLVFPIPLEPLVAFLGFGMTFLMFAAIAVVGIIVIAQGIVERDHVVYAPAAYTTAPAAVPATAGAYEALSEFDLSVLRKVSEKKSDGRIAAETGTSKAVVRERIALLKSRGYITWNRHLTDRGYATIAAPETRVVRAPPPPPP